MSHTTALLAEIEDWCETEGAGITEKQKTALRDLLLAKAIHRLAAGISVKESAVSVQKFAADLSVDAAKRYAG